MSDSSKTRWVMVRVPDWLHAEIVAVCNRIERGGTRGLMDVPAEFADRGGVPMWYAVHRAVRELNSKWARSNRSVKKTRRRDAENAERQ